MRSGVGILGLLLALVVVGLLARKQLGVATGAAPASQAGVAAPVGLALQQSQQLQNQVKRSVEEVMQQKRPEAPDQ